MIASSIQIYLTEANGVQIYFYFIYKKKLKGYIVKLFAIIVAVIIIFIIIIIIIIIITIVQVWNLNSYAVCIGIVFFFFIVEHFVAFYMKMLEAFSYLCAKLDSTYIHVIMHTFLHL